MSRSQHSTFRPYRGALKPDRPLRWVASARPGSLVHLACWDAQASDGYNEKYQGVLCGRQTQLDRRRMIEVADLAADPRRVCRECAHRAPEDA